MSEPPRISYVARSVRVHGGSAVIEGKLADEVRRAGGTRAFLVTSPSVAAHSDLVPRVTAALGPSLAGVFDGIEKDTTYTSVRAATDAARGVSADLVVTLGGGSVIVAGRALAIFLAERGDPFELMTQYAPGRAPVSPRLDAPKPPVVNIPVTPTAAINRAGVGLKSHDLDHRMEFFDPKTRPRAILFDLGALRSPPLPVLRSTATTLFAATLAGAAAAGDDPISEGDRRQSFELARRGYDRLTSQPDDRTLLELCTAALLQNRAEDADRQVARRGAFAGNYAVSTALHVRFPTVGQGAATSALAATVMRTTAAPEARQAERAARGLGLWREGWTARRATDAVADAVDEAFARVGMPTRVGQLGFSRSELPMVAAETVKNFNFSSTASDPDLAVQQSLALLEAAW